jgi:Peptidase family M23
MSVRILSIVALTLYLNCVVGASSFASDPAPEASAPVSPFPLQLELRVPFEPTAFPSNGSTYLVYELYLTNLSSSPITIRRVEVLSSNDGAIHPVAAFEGQELDALLNPVNAPEHTNTYTPRQLGAGSTIVAFMWLSFGSGTNVPSLLRHRVVTADDSVEGAIIGTHRTKLQILAPPLQGGNWLASDGPSNDPDNHHRRGLLVMDGHTAISRRYAIDWKRTEKDASFLGDPRDKRSYYSYGAPVFAVADARVIEAVDGLPENVPGHGAAFHPAVPITMETIGGNTVTLDLGGGQYAYYFHLQPNTLRVKVGERVARGEVIARIGCSGDAREPHLHFELTTSAGLMSGEGLPYVINQYRTKMINNEWQTHTRELPLSNMLVDFGPAYASSK